MKIKNSYLSLRTEALSKIFCLICCLSTALRTFQLFFHIEPETGFNTGSHLLMLILYVIVIGGCLAFSAVSFLSKETAVFDIEGIKSKKLSAFTALFAFFLLGDWLVSVFDGVSSYAVTEVNSGFKGLMASGVLTGSLQGFFAFFSMIYFVIFAFDMLKGTDVASRFKLMALAPVGWSSVRLVHRFISQISFLEVSDLFLELVMLSFTVMFFMAFAQVVSGVNSTGFSWRIYGFGLSSALVAITINVSRCIVALIKGSEALNPSHQPEIVDIAFAIFVILLVSVKSKNTEEV